MRDPPFRDEATLRVNLCVAACDPSESFTILEFVYRECISRHPPAQDGSPIDFRQVSGGEAPCRTSENSNILMFIEANRKEEAIALLMEAVHLVGATRRRSAQATLKTAVRLCAGESVSAFGDMAKGVEGVPKVNEVNRIGRLIRKASQ